MGTTPGIWRDLKTKYFCVRYRNFNFCKVSSLYWKFICYNVPWSITQELLCNPVLNATYCEPAFWRLTVIFMTELLYKMIAFGLKLRPAGFLWVCWFSAFLLHASKPCHTAATYSTCTGISVSFRIWKWKNFEQGNCRECPEKCCLCSTSTGLILRGLCSMNPGFPGGPVFVALPILE